MEQASGPPTKDRSPPVAVLLIEDNVDHAFLVRQSLTAARGFDVQHVRTGTEGLEAARKRSFAAIVLDHRLPDWDGVKLVRELRKRGEKCALLVVSSGGRESLAEDADAAGADAFMVKSAGFEERLADEILLRGEMRRT